MSEKSSTHIIPLKPTFDDLDIGGIVYNPNHMIYCDRARNDFFASRGENVMDMFQRDIVFAVASCSAQYKLPLFMEQYKLATKLAKTSEKVLFFQHAILPVDVSDSDITASKSLETIQGLRFFADYTLVCVSITKKSTQSIPKDFLEKFL
jgi:YbgC/YbaW family acyl-CoA thioester hydrolase